MASSGPVISDRLCGSAIAGLRRRAAGRRLVVGRQVGRVVAGGRTAVGFLFHGRSLGEPFSMARPATFFVRLCALVVLGMAGPSVRAAGESGTFAVISDIHFNPFASPKDQATSHIGEDTNHALLASGIAAFARAMATADFAIVPGDLLVHEFNAKAATALGVDRASPAVTDMATKTTLFVADALASALGGKPAFVALGNEDSKLRRLQDRARRAIPRRDAGNGASPRGCRAAGGRLRGDLGRGGLLRGAPSDRGERADRRAERRAVVDPLPGRLRVARARRRPDHDELAPRAVGAATRGRRPGLAGASHPLGNRRLRDDQRQGPVLCRRRSFRS